MMARPSESQQLRRQRVELVPALATSLRAGVVGGIKRQPARQRNCGFEQRAIGEFSPYLRQPPPGGFLLVGIRVDQVDDEAVGLLVVDRRDRLREVAQIGVALVAEGGDVRPQPAELAVASRADAEELLVGQRIERDRAKLPDRAMVLRGLESPGRYPPELAFAVVVSDGGAEEVQVLGARMRELAPRVGA